METEGSLPSLQVPATLLYPEPGQSSTTLSSKWPISLNIII